MFILGCALWGAGCKEKAKRNRLRGVATGAGHRGSRGNRRLKAGALVLGDSGARGDFLREV